MSLFGEVTIQGFLLTSLSSFLKMKLKDPSLKLKAGFL